MLPRPNIVHVLKQQFEFFERFFSSEEVLDHMPAVGFGF